jgi:MFS family permease
MGADLTVEMGRTAIASRSPIAGEDRRRIFLYLGGLILLTGFGDPLGGLIDLPVGFFLKNKLHLSAHQTAVFGLASHIPLYVAFAFGFVRDGWSPFGRGDRAYLMIFGALGAVGCLAAAAVPPSYGSLLACMVLMTAAWLFAYSAVGGLSATIGQQHAMSGEVSGALQTFAVLPSLAAFLAGGALSELMEGQKAAQGARLLFLAIAGVMALIAAYGAFKPASVFTALRPERLTSEKPLEDVRRLLRHWPLYPALLIWLLWNFVPGLGTPLTYYMQNSLHGSDSQCALWRALYLAGFLPPYLAFGWLSRRFSLRALLWAGTIIAIPMMFPLLAMPNMRWALGAAPVMGATGGIANAAFVSLIIRACPRGLQGTATMGAASLLALDGALGNVLGARLFDRFHDFTVCVVAMTVTDVAILPVLLLVPRRLIAGRDGEALAHSP